MENCPQLKQDGASFEHRLHTLILSMVPRSLRLPSLRPRLLPSSVVVRTLVPLPLMVAMLLSMTTHDVMGTLHTVQRGANSRL